MKEQITVVLNIVFDYFAPSLRVAQISKSYRNCFKIQIGQFI